MTNINEKDKGKRVELIYTNDPFTKLKPGNKGTYGFLFEHSNPLENQHIISWDSGSNLMMVHGDRFKFIDVRVEEKQGAQDN